MPHSWLYISATDLRIELMQCADEGRDVAKLQPQFEALIKALESVPGGYDLNLAARAGRLLDKTALLKVKRGYPFVEPSRLSAIRARRGAAIDLPTAAPAGAALLDKIHGAWTGRCCGCLLGKPVEGRKRREMETICAGRAAGR